MPIPQLSPSKKTTPKKESQKKRKVKKRRRFLRWTLKIAIVLCFLSFLGLGSVFAWYSKDLPNPEKIRERDVAESTRIYDRTGTILLYEIHGEQRRTIVPLKDIPKHMINATIITEDRGFYSHKGLDFKGIARATLTNLLRGDLKGQGGSTITQQFIKNAILTNEKKLNRKIKEAILAFQIERKFSKDEILQLYFNEIPYGSNVYGIEAASNFYFGKRAKDLSLAEAAILAALPQRPTYYSPYGTNTEELFSRQQYILDQMTQENVITQEAAETAKSEKLTFKSRIENIRAPHFVFYVRTVLEEKFRENIVEQGGLRVITTLDINKQIAAEEAIRLNMEKVEQYGGSNAALTALDTRTGQILAMVGSRNYFDTEHDGNVNVTLANRQPASSIKPLIYASAFAKGYTPRTMIFDLARDFPTETGKYHPRNYDLREHGPVEMQKALAGSLNIPAVMTLYLTGIDTVLNNAEKFGYSTLRDRSRFGLALVLGGAEVKLLEHTAAFATFAREGEYHKPTPILRIEDKQGKVLNEFHDQPKQVFDAQVLRQLNAILSNDALRAFIFGARGKLTLPDRPAAAKTGTTNDYRDAWAMGYTPSIAAGVWVGSNDNSEMKKGADGSVIAAPIWNQFMQEALKDTPVETFKKPDPIKTTKPRLRGEIDTLLKKKVDKITGKIIPDECIKTYPKEYIIEKEFKATHSILHEVDKDNPQGPAPRDPFKDPYYAIWEAAVERWAEGQPGYLTKKNTQYEDCHLRDASKAPQVSILSPKQDEAHTTSTFTITSQAEATKGRSLQKVEFRIDNTLVDTQIQSPFQTKYTPNTLTNGKHTLRVTGFDNTGSGTEASASFTFTAEPLTADEIFFLQPKSNTILTSQDFPLTLEFALKKPIQVQQIKFHYFDTQEENPEHFIIATITSNFSDKVKTTWNAKPNAGNYALYAKVTTKSGEVLRTKNIQLKIR